MSKFTENIEQKKEFKRKESVRRETLGKYFYDLSKLTFAALVLGVVRPLAEDFDNMVLRAMFVVGVYLVAAFAYVGNRTLKY